MKVISAFCLGAALVALVTMSVDRRRPAKRSGAAIRVERVDKATGDSESDYLWLANRTRQFMFDLQANFEKPYTPKGAFANVGKAH